MIHLKLNMGLSFAQIAAKVRVSPSTVHKVISGYKHDPEEFVKVLKDSADTQKHFGADVGDVVADAALNNAHLLTSKKKFAKFLASKVIVPESWTDRRIFNVARKDLCLISRKPKCDRSLHAKAHSDMSLAMVDNIMLNLFYIRENMAIFDASCFLNDKLGLHCWSLRGVRPCLPGSNKVAGMHLMLLLFPDGTFSAQLLKHGVTEAVTSDFLMSAMSRRMAEKPNSTRIKFIFWDNASANSSRITQKLHANFSTTCIYNLPRNPTRNPVESAFGAIKKHYRSVAAKNRGVISDDIRDSLRFMLGERIEKTLSHVKSLICTSLSTYFK